MTHRPHGAHRTRLRRSWPGLAALLGRIGAQRVEGVLRVQDAVDRRRRHQPWPSVSSSGWRSWPSQGRKPIVTPSSRRVDVGQRLLECRHRALGRRRRGATNALPASQAAQSCPVMARPAAFAKRRETCGAPKRSKLAARPPPPARRRRPPAAAARCGRAGRGRIRHRCRRPRPRRRFAAATPVSSSGLARSRSRGSADSLNGLAGHQLQAVALDRRLRGGAACAVLAAAARSAAAPGSSGARPASAPARRRACARWAAGAAAAAGSRLAQPVAALAQVQQRQLRAVGGSQQPVGGQVGQQRGGAGLLGLGRGVARGGGRADPHGVEHDARAVGVHFELRFLQRHLDPPRPTVRRAGPAPAARCGCDRAAGRRRAGSAWP